jgi:hypothetical protein
MCVAFSLRKLTAAKLPAVRSLQIQAAAKLASGLRSAVAYRNPKPRTVRRVETVSVQGVTGGTDQTSGGCSLC